MAEAKLILENDEGQTITAPVGYSLSTLLLGPISPLIRRDLKHFSIAVITFLPSIGLSWFVAYPAQYNRWFIKDRLRAGFRVVEVIGDNLQSVEKRLNLNLATNSKSEDFADSPLPSPLSQRTPISGEAQQTPDNKNTKIAPKRRIAFVILLAILTVFYVGNSFYYTQRLATLRKNDPAAYLDALKNDKARQDEYWLELIILDPDRYEREWPAEESRRKREERQKAKERLDRLSDADGDEYWYALKLVEPTRYYQTLSFRQDDFFDQIYERLNRPPKSYDPEVLEAYVTARNFSIPHFGQTRLEIGAAVPFDRKCSGSPKYVGFDPAVIDKLNDQWFAAGNILHANQLYNPLFEAGINYLDNAAVDGARQIYNSPKYENACVYFDHALRLYFEKALPSD